MKKIILLVIASFILTGCASTQITKGMNKEQVKAIMGEPDSIKNSKNSCCREKDEEAWHYFGSSIPLADRDKSIVFNNDEVKYIFVY